VRVVAEESGRNVQRFRGGLVFMAHRLCASLNSRLESNKEEEEEEEEAGVFSGGGGCRPFVSLNSRLQSNKEEERRRRLSTGAPALARDD